uniref:glutathione transferase n=1 Tax=Mus spicilegus TaxID=10103 RepID=A0A8C6IIK6_MUSSI
MVNKNSCTVFSLQFEEKFIKILKDLKRLKNDGSLMFQQVPTVEIDGMKLVQTRAILNYIAFKYNLYGKDMKERALYNEVPVLKNGYHKKVNGRGECSSATMYHICRGEGRGGQGEN